MRGKFLTLAGLALVVGAQPVFSQSTKLDATKSAVSLGGRSGERFTFDCPAIDQPKNRVYGTDTYTADSPICQAAIHAGVLKRGRAGAVTIEIGRGAREYLGSTQNGVTSASFGPYASSYTFVAAAPVRATAATPAGSEPPAATPGDERLVALEQKMTMLEQKVATLEQQKGVLEQKVAMLEQQSGLVATLEQKVSTLEQQNTQLRQFIVINGQKLQIKSPQDLLIQAAFLDIKGTYVRTEASTAIQMTGLSQIEIYAPSVLFPSPTGIKMGGITPATLFNRVQVNLSTGHGQVLPGYPQ